MNKRLFLAAVAALNGFTAPVFSQITYVTPNGAGNQSGTSWADALPGSRLRSAMLTSPPTAPNAQIWLAAGTYKPHPTSRDSSFYLAPSVKLYGGFNGTETQLSQRNWNTNLTILSGDIGIPNDSSDNSYHVVHFELSDGALIDGCTITGGSAINGGFYQNMGGGVLNLSVGLPTSTSSPALSNCRITGNRATGFGGGLCNYALTGTATVTLDNCIFDHNEGSAGGAIFSMANASTLLQVPTGNTAVMAAHCSFTANRSGQGGAVNMTNSGSQNNLTFTGCDFTDNSSATLGGAICYTSLSPSSSPYTGRTCAIRIDSCSFTRNVSGVDGMALYLTNQYLERGDVTISHSRFEENRSLQDYHGLLSLQHLSSLRTNTRITGCRFLNNNRGRGGYPVYSTAGYAQGGDVMNTGTDSLLVSNSFFYNNGNGTDIYATANDGARHYTTVANCTIYHDSSTSTFINSVQANAGTYGGSQVANVTESAIEVQNSVLWHHLTAWLVGAQMELRTETLFLPAGAAHIRTTNSVLTGAGIPWPVDYGVNGGGNSGLYPGFIDTAGMDFHLSCGSFGVDRGSNALIRPAGLATDVTGAARIYNNIVDIGAFETDPSHMLPVATPVTSLSNGMLTYSYTAAADSVRWTFGDGDTSLVRNGTHTYRRSGTYTVCLHVKNACGSKDSCFSQAVTVSANGIGQAGAGDAISLYPNPAGNTLYLHGLSGSFRLRICTIAGTTVHTAVLPAGNDPAIDVSRLPAGSYLLELCDQQGAARHARFVKQ